MAPLLAQLKLRSSLYDDPNNNLDQATLLLQQATDATDSQVSLTLLQRVVKRLVAAAEASPSLSAVSLGLSSGAGSLSSGEASGVEGKRYVRLWADVTKLAAKHRHIGLVQSGANVVRQLSWRVDLSREMVILQAEVDLILADALSAYVTSLPQSDAVVEGDDEEEKGEVDEAALKQLEEEVCHGLVVLWRKALISVGMYCCRVVLCWPSLLAELAWTCQQLRM
jgi:hypothetical protein